VGTIDSSWSVVYGNPANFSGPAPREGLLRLAGCPQLSGAPSGGHDANISGDTLITPGHTRPAASAHRRIGSQGSTNTGDAKLKRFAPRALRNES